MFNSLSKSAAESGLNWSEIGLLLVSAIVAAGLIGEYRKDRDERWKGLTDTFELMVIIGVVGEVLFDGLIFGFSGRLSRIQDDAVAVAIASAGNANEAAEKANKAAEEANRVATETSGLAIKATELADKLSKINEAFEKKYGPLVKGMQPRDVDESDLRDGMRLVPRGNITIIKLDDAEPRTVADKLETALRNLKFKVQSEDLHGTSPLTGVIVCQRGSGEIKLVKGLNAARLGASLMPLKAPNRPDFCDFPIHTGVFGPHAAADRGTVIFVAQRPQPSK